LFVFVEISHSIRQAGGGSAAKVRDVYISHKEPRSAWSKPFSFVSTHIVTALTPQATLLELLRMGLETYSTKKSEPAPKMPAFDGWSAKAGDFGGESCQTSAISIEDEDGQAVGKLRLKACRMRRSSTVDLTVFPVKHENGFMFDPDDCSIWRTTLNPDYTDAECQGALEELGKDCFQQMKAGLGRKLLEAERQRLEREREESALQ
jgi:hypothetical protein